MKRLLVIAAMTLASCGGAATSGASSQSSNSAPVATTGAPSTNPTSATSAQLPPTTVPIDLTVGLACFDLTKVDFGSHVAMRSGGLTGIELALGQFYESAHALVATSTATCPSPLTFEGPFDEYGIVVSGGVTVTAGSYMNISIPDAAPQVHVQTALLLAASAITDNAADATALAQEAFLARERPASGPVCGAVGVALQTYSARDARTDADSILIKLSAC